MYIDNTRVSAVMTPYTTKPVTTMAKKKSSFCVKCTIEGIDEVQYVDIKANFASEVGKKFDKQMSKLGRKVQVLEVRKNK